jgi:hypothetical protein
MTVKTLRLVVRDDLDPSGSPNGDYRGAAKADRHPLDDRIRVWDAASRAIAMATTRTHRPAPVAGSARSSA